MGSSECLANAVQHLGPLSSHSHLLASPPPVSSPEGSLYFPGCPAQQGHWHSAPASSLWLTGHWPSLHTTVPAPGQPVTPGPTGKPHVQKDSPLGWTQAYRLCSPSPRDDPASPSTNPAMAPSSPLSASCYPLAGIQGPSGHTPVPGLSCLMLPLTSLGTCCPLKSEHMPWM